MLGKELLVATMMVVLVVFLHLMGLAMLWRALRSHMKVFRSLRILPLTLLLSATLGLILLHTVDIWLFAGLYLYLGVFRTLEQGLYFSTVTYSSLGYGDVLLPNDWRLLGSIRGRPHGLCSIRPFGR